MLNCPLCSATRPRGAAFPLVSWNRRLSATPAAGACSFLLKHEDPPSLHWVSATPCFGSSVSTHKIRYARRTDGYYFRNLRTLFPRGLAAFTTPVPRESGRPGQDLAMGGPEPGGPSLMHGSGRCMRPTAAAFIHQAREPRLPTGTQDISRQQTCAEIQPPATTHPLDVHGEEQNSTSWRVSPAQQQPPPCNVDLPQFEARKDVTARVVGWGNNQLFLDVR